MPSIFIQICRQKRDRPPQVAVSQFLVHLQDGFCVFPFLCLEKKHTRNISVHGKMQKRPARQGKRSRAQGYSSLQSWSLGSVFIFLPLSSSWQEVLTSEQSNILKRATGKEGLQMRERIGPAPLCFLLDR